MCTLASPEEHCNPLQATREKFMDYITVLKEALRDGAEASAAHTAGILLLPPKPDLASAPPDKAAGVQTAVSSWPMGAWMAGSYQLAPSQA